MDHLSSVRDGMSTLVGTCCMAPTKGFICPGWGGVSQVVHPLGSLFVQGGDKSSLVNPNSCRLPTGGWWWWRLHDAREREGELYA